MTALDFKEHAPVIYVPNHARGDVNHPDVERGVVTSVNDTYVFVNFPPGSGSKACYPHNLLLDK